MEFRISYFKEALKEPINIGGLLLSGAAAAYSSATGFIEPTLVLAGALVLEGAYLVTVPASSFYRKIVDRRSRHLLEEHRRKQRLELIKTFDPREREAVEYLSWMKKQIADNYKNSRASPMSRRNCVNSNQRGKRLLICSTNTAGAKSPAHDQPPDGRKSTAAGRTHRAIFRSLDAPAARKERRDTATPFANV